MVKYPVYYIRNKKNPRNSNIITVNEPAQKPSQKLVDSVLGVPKSEPVEFSLVPFEEKVERVKERQHELMKCPRCTYQEPANKIMSMLKHIREKHGQDSLVKFRMKQSTVLKVKVGS